MTTYITPLLFLIALFVIFGMTHHHGKHSGGCAGCTGTGCQDNAECSKEDKPRHH